MNKAILVICLLALIVLSGCAKEKSMDEDIPVERDVEKLREFEDTIKKQSLLYDSLAEIGIDEPLIDITRERVLVVYNLPDDMEKENVDYYIMAAAAKIAPEAGLVHLKAIKDSMPFETVVAEMPKLLDLINEKIDLETFRQDAVVVYKDAELLNNAKKELTADVIRETLGMEGRLHVSHDFYKNIGVEKKADLAIVVADEAYSPVVEIIIGEYGSLLEEQYLEEPYKSSGAFEYNKAGSRSYSTLSRTKDSSITSNQLYFSSSDRHWDIQVFYHANADEMEKVYALGEKIDKLLSA